MTTELVLLLSIFAFVTAGAIFGPKGPFKVFQKSAPRLAARVEQNLATGRDFKVLDGGQKAIQMWFPPRRSATGWNVMIAIFAASSILISGVVDDLRSRKFHNWLFLGCLGFGILCVLATGGVSALPMALLGLAGGIAIFLPMVLLKIIGAGDMKLMGAFGLVAGWDAVLTTALWSLIWGAIFGVVAVIARGHLKTLVHNMVSIVVVRERKGLELQKIPFTIAILMGWLSHLVLRGVL